MHVIAQCRQILMKALHEISDRLQHGDVVLNRATGVTVRVPVRARDAAAIMAISMSLLRGSATVRVIPRRYG